MLLLVLFCNKRKNSPFDIGGPVNLISNLIFFGFSSFKTLSKESCLVYHLTYINICQWIISFVVISRAIQDLDLICFKASYFCFLLALNRFFEISLRTLLVNTAKGQLQYLPLWTQKLSGINFFLKRSIFSLQSAFPWTEFEPLKTPEQHASGKYFCQTLSTFDCVVLFIKTLPLLTANCHVSKYRKLTFNTDLTFDRNE